MDQREKRIQFYSAAALLLASFFSLGYHHFDEHFQIFEFAAYKLGMVEAHELPWEFNAQMRPTIQPSMVYFTHKLFDSIGLSNPFHLAWFFRFISATLSFYLFRLLYKSFKHHFKGAPLSHWFLALSFLSWFFIYNGVRFSSENWSTLFFFIPFALYFKEEKKGALRFLFLGILLGFSFLFRFQVAFMTVGFLAWLALIKREKWQHILSLMFGGILIVGLGILIDSWFYEEWVVSPYNYFQENIMDDKSSHFGVMPWWWYFNKFFVQGVPPISLLFILAIIYFIIRKPKSVFSWCFIPFFLVHCYISHKELRFLFPLLGFLPFMTAKALSLLNEKYTDILNNKLFQGFIKLSLFVNFVFVIIVSFRPADPHIALYKSLYNQYKEPITFYHFGRNPYHRILEIRYYKSENLTIQQIESLDDIPDGEHALVVFGGKDRATDEFANQHQLIYTSIPEWIKPLNFNNWQERTKIWSVYEINKPNEL